MRGNAASTIASLIFADKHRAPYFQSVLRQVVSDPDISVRVCAAEALTAMLNHDRDTAVQLFLELCDTQEDLLLGTPPVERFLHYALQSHFEQLKPVLNRMLNSDLSEVAEAGARNSCCISLVIEQAKPLADHCLSGHEGHRLAAAEVFANNIRSAHFRQECKDALILLFNDPDEKVRAQSAKCFFDMEGEELSKYLDLVNQFISSAAFLNSFHDLIWAMERTTARLPEIICMMCDRYITDLLEENSRNGKAFRTDINLICKLLMTSYSQSSKQPELQSQCLNLIDRLAVIGLYDLDKVLEEYER